MMYLDTPPNNEALRDMNDIVSAPAATWWPLAPGWYVLAGIAITLLVILVWILVRRWQQRRMLRLALRQLASQPTTDTAATTALLKQALLAYYPRTRIAQLQGADWWLFLQQQLPNKAAQRWQPVIEQVAATYYAAHTESTIATEYHRYAQFWLRQALPPKGGQHD